MRKRIVLFTFLSAAACVALYSAPADSKTSGKTAMTAPVPAVAADKVQEIEDFESRRYTGLMVSPSVVNIVPRVSGEILEVGFHDGDAVKQGQMLYRLDPVQYDAAVKSAEAKIAECKAKLEYSQKNYDRTLALYEKNAMSRDSMENTKSSLEANKASLLAGEAELIRAKDDLKNTLISAPIAGIAGVTNYTKGNYITPSSGTLVTIIQVSPIRVRFSISTADFLNLFGSLEKLKKLGSVKIKLSNGTLYPEDGEIELINNEANKNTDTIQIFAKFKNENHDLIVGSTVEVRLSKKKGAKVPAISPAAIMHDNNGSFVYVVGKDNMPEKRYVVLGNATSDMQMVTSGLKPGETVITSGVHKVYLNSPVELVNTEK